MGRQIGPDHVIAALASAQGGRVSREQLLRQGIGAGAIDARVRAGRLHPDHRGVYSVGHAATTTEGRWWAALLACGEESVLSHSPPPTCGGCRHAVTRSSHARLVVELDGYAYHRSSEAFERDRARDA